MTGKIVKGIAGFYYVKVVGSAIYECRAKGIFRKEGIKPLVGDDVEIELTHEKDMEANIVHILPRKNELRRPQISNADQVLLIFALEDPKPGAGVLDRFLIQMERQDLPVIICFNKNDLADAAAADEWTGIYKDAGYETFAFSVKNGIGMDAVKKALDRKTTVIAGPSGVGKSSFINYLVPSAEMETGQTSRKLGKGKNTTRHSELFEAWDETYICDTPGFTSFEPEEMEKEDLRFLFPEFLPYEGKCRFDGCVHVDEPGCSLKEAVAEGKVRKQRYASYVQIYGELKEAEKHRY